MNIRMKKILLLSFLVFSASVLFPGTASATEQIFMGRTSGYDTTNTTYLVPGQRNAGSFTSFATTTSALSAVAGTFSTLYAYTSANTNATWTFTLTVNGVDRSVTCQITSGNSTCSDLSNTFTIAEGDSWAIKVTRTVDTTRVAYFSIKFTPTTPNETMLFTAANTAWSASLTQFTGWNFFNGNPPVGSSATGNAQPWIESGTIDRFRVAATSSLTSGSYTFTLRAGANQQNSLLSCTMNTTASFCVDSTNATSTKFNDMIGITGVPSSPSTRGFSFAARYVSDTPGNYLLTGACGWTGTATQYCPVIGTGITTTEASSTMYAQPMVITGMVMRGNTSIGAGNRIYTLRVNGQDTALTCSGQNCSVTGAININQGDLIVIGQTTTGSPNNEASAFSLRVRPPGGAGTTYPVTPAKTKIWTGFLKIIGGYVRIR
jgi:hypothetical protein